MIQTIFPREEFVVGNLSSSLTLFLRLYLVFPWGRLYWIKVVEDLLELLLCYLPQSGDSCQTTHGRLSSPVIEDPEADNPANFLLLSRGFFSQDDEIEDDFDVVCLSPPRALLYLRLSWA